MSDLRQAAMAYLAAGLCVLPARRAQKRPAVGAWKPYQQRRPTPAELAGWLAQGPDGLCIVCGAVSGHVETIDFDAGGEQFGAWADRIPAALRDRLVIEATPSGGWHVVYRCPAGVSGNLKLAQRRRENGTVVTLIETRGEGGLFLCAPTAGYELMQGELDELPVLTAEERDMLLSAAWELNAYVPPVVNGPRLSAEVGQRGALSANRGTGCAENAQGGDCPSDSVAMGQRAPSSAAHGDHAANSSHIGGCLSNSAALGQRVPSSAAQDGCAAENAHTGGCPSDNGALGQRVPSSAPHRGCASDNAALGDGASHRAAVGPRAPSSAAQDGCAAENAHTGRCRSHNGDVGQRAASSAPQGDCAAGNAHIGGCPSNMAPVRPTGPSSAAQEDCPPENARGGDSPSHSGAVRPTGSSSAPQGHGGTDSGQRPGDEFNLRGDVRAVLQQYGWSLARPGENEYWRRPGKPNGWSATLKDRVFYVFSANAAPFEPNHAYAPFAVYALLAHGGDFEQAARTLRQQGFGSSVPREADPGVDTTGLLPHHPAPPAEDTGPTIHRLRTLIESFQGLNPPIIHGLLREGETMNIIASPKIGKSWFVSRLAISVASGLTWLGLPVEQGRVLHIDNELHANTSAYRYRVISQAMDVPHTLYSENIDFVSLRGQLRDLNALGQWFGRLEPGHYKLVVLDAFYRTLPPDTDENDNGAMAGLYNQIDWHAARLRCAFVLIHHASKGNQAGKAITDVGAGAGSQSRAADTHMILRPHEEQDVLVLESAVRSWPPLAPRALRWQWPLFHPADDVDPSALLGAVKPKASTPEVELAGFVERCVAIHDPCSQRSVRYEAAQAFGLSERRAGELLDLALERGLVARIRVGSSMRYVAGRPGVVGDKGLWTAAILAHRPDADLQQVAEEVGATERYVRQIRQHLSLTEVGVARN